MWKNCLNAVIEEEEIKNTVKNFSGCIVLSIKFDGASIMVFGCFSAAGPGTLVPVKGNVNVST